MLHRSRSAPYPAAVRPDEPGPQPDAPRPVEPHRIKRTRASELWTGLVAAAVIGIALLIFIVQNGHNTTVRFVTVQGHVPLAAALLAAAILGSLIVLIPGAIRMGQLRAAARRHRRADQAGARQAA